MGPPINTYAQSYTVRGKNNHGIIKYQLEVCHIGHTKAPEVDTVTGQNFPEVDTVTRKTILVYQNQRCHCKSLWEATYLQLS